MSVIVDVVINTDQAEQQLQALQQQMADDLAAGAAQMGQAAGRAAGATARAAGKNATEEFLRAFDPDKLRSELESAGLGEQEIEIILDTTKAKAETQALKDSIAGALSEASGLAEDQLKQITAQVAREVDRAAGKVKSVTEIVDGVRELKTEMQDLGAAGQAASEGIGMLVLNETVDKFGDLKDIFEKTGEKLFGLSEQTVEYGVLIGDVAEKGASIGAAFGPIGAGIGLVAGGILGGFTAAADAAKKVEEATKAQQDQLIETQEYVTGLRLSYEDLASVSFDGIMRNLDELQKKQQDLEKTERATQEQRVLYAQQLVTLGDATNETLFAGAQKVSENISEVLSDIDQQLAKPVKAKTLDELRNAATDAALNLEDTKAQLVALTAELAKPKGSWGIDALNELYNKYVTLTRLAGKQGTELAKAEGEVAKAEDKVAKAASGSASAMSARREEMEKGIRNAKGKLTAFGELEAMEAKHAKNMKARTDLEKTGTDLLTELEKDLQKSKKETAELDEKIAKKDAEQKKYQQEQAEQAIKNAEALAKAQQDAAKANVEAYRQILSPYADFVGGIFTSFTEGMLAGQSATEAFAEATRRAIASALGSLAKELGVKSLANLAEGFAALSNPFTAAAAPGFFKASALYAAAAAAAGLGSSVLSTAGANSGASGLGAAGGGAAGTAAAGNTSTSLGRAAQETGTPAPIVIDLRGAMFPTADLTAAQSFGEAVARSLAAASAGNQPMARRLIGSRGFVV